MRTKAVYVVTCLPKDYYFEQLVLSAFSLHYHNPDMETIVVMDDITASNISEKRQSHLIPSITEVIVRELPKHLNMMERSRFLKTSLRQIIKGDFIFIDTDTIITEDLSDLDNIAHSVSAVPDKHVCIGEHSGASRILSLAKKFGWDAQKDSNYFNSGVLLVKDDSTSKELFEKWHYHWRTGLEKYHVSIDQPSLALANQECGNPIVELSGIYNCQIVENGIRFLHHSKIIHYFASNINKWPAPYLFRNPQLYNEIREKGITEEIIEKVRNAKSQFADKTLILGGDLCDCYYSFLSGFARRVFKSVPSLDRLLNRVYSYLTD